MPPRLFTREEAEQALPRIAPMLEEMRELKRKHDESQAQLAALEEKARSNGHSLDVDIARARQVVQQCALAINGIIERVKAMGAEVKDIDTGLIDFRANVHGREAYLCWKLGEGDRISWWHDLDAGFAARAPLD